jgi:uncharacterized protein
LCQEHKLRFGLLAVVNPAVSGSQTYRHFVDELKLRHFDFLIPEANYTSKPLYPDDAYGRFMSEVFNEWIKDNNDNPKVFIRFCVNIIELFLGSYSRVEGFGKRDGGVLPLICVSNNGDLGPLDELRTCVPEMFVKHNIKSRSWKDFLQDDFFKRFLQDMSSSPDECKQCCFEKVCSGGTYSHRYDETANDFSRKSIYCSSLKYFYKNVLKYFLNHGYTQEQMQNFLGVN